MTCAPATRYPNLVDLDEIIRVLRAFETAGLEYVLIGAAAMGFHGIVRATEDLDLFIKATPENIERLRSALRQAYDDDALVEPFLDTREFQVAVWGNDRPESLPPSEIVYTAFADPRDRLHTQQWKIDRESRGYKEIQMPCPAPLDRPDWRRRVEQVGVEAYKALGLRDYARFDMRMMGDEPQILDVNANPELDPESIVLAGAKAQGMTYGQMAGRIISFASARMPAGG